MSLPNDFYYYSSMDYTVPTPNVFLLLVWPAPLSLATTRGISVDFFSSPYLDVSVREVPLINLCIQLMIYDSSSYVFPHSEICGSRLICSSPQLIAACHVLLRLLMPRHSLYALLSLNSFMNMISHTYSVLSLLELLCITFFQLLNLIFALAKLFLLLPFWKDLISNYFVIFVFFPFCLIFKSVRVLKIRLIRFSMNIRLLSPATFFLSQIIT